MPLDGYAADEKVIKQVDENSKETGVIFVLNAEKYNFEKLWEDKIAPTRDGYVFGGWYTNPEEDGSGTFSAVKETQGTEEANVWAKFVPAEVLSIRAQLQKATEDGSDNREEGDKTYLRLLSGVSGLDYQKVGFDILYNKKTSDTAQNIETATNITKVFSKITNDETGADGMAASSLFGDAATHFSVLRLDGIGFKNYTKVIYVTPQWTTLDGTLVEGQAKYVRVMDGYAENRYISVPVNFLEGSAVAAGQLEMTYDSDKLEVVEVDTNGYDAGEQKTEGSYYDNKTGTIKFVNNITGTANIEPESVVYANVWFKVKQDVTIESGKALEFKMGEYSFCNWEEEPVTDINAWDFKYLK